MNNRIKLKLFHIVMCAMLFGLLASAHADEDKPVAVVAADSYDFGEVFEGSDVIHDFIIKNTGNADLEIQSAKAG